MSLIKFDIQDQIAVITLNRPDRMNAYNVEMHYALIDAFESADMNPEVRVVVITGAGEVFCAGADISDGFGALSDPEKFDGISRDYGGMLNLRVFECDTPVIAAVNGAAVGVGATMLLPMDIVIAERTSKFAFPFGRRGITFDGAASFFLPHVVGLGTAREWILKGDIIKADEAHKAGMVQEIAETGMVFERAVELARDISVNVSPTSAAQNKQLLRAHVLNGNDYGGGPMGAHMAESVLLEHAFTSRDCIEGVRAFFEKRSPTFKNYERNP